MAIPAIGAIAMAAVRVVGGIVGKGSKNINPVYKNVGEPKSGVKVVPQGLRGRNQQQADSWEMELQQLKRSK